jgi:hypothetical protein
MFIDEYCTKHDDNIFSFSRSQASRFAKFIANDFNPLHDIENTRFCVPGDLLFAKIISMKGMFKYMNIHFGGMVSNDVMLQVKNISSTHFEICDDNGKVYLDVEISGSPITDEKIIKNAIFNYVAFSGKNFPDVFVPLMKSKGVMINTKKPLVIYDNMSLEFFTSDLKKPELKAEEATFDVLGKRGKVTLNFSYKDGNKEVGTGQKTMILSGLRPYSQDDIDQMIVEHKKRIVKFTEDK